MPTERWNSDEIIATIGANAAAAEPVPMGSFAGGGFIPSASLTGLAFYGNTKKGDTLVVIADADNAAVTRDVTINQYYALPDECFACAEIGLVHASGGSAQMILKS